MGGTLSTLIGYDNQLHLQSLLGNAAGLREMVMRSGEYSVFDDLLVAHVDTKTADGTTGLMICAVFDHVDAARVLLDKGANPNEVDKYGSHALIYAATGGHAEMVKLLLGAKGCKRELANAFDANALWSAAFNGQLECVEILLTQGRCSTAPSQKTKSTPLHAAAYTGRVEVVRLLLRYGMTDSKDSLGLSAFMLAEMKGHTEIADILRQHERDLADAAAKAARDAAEEEARRAANPNGLLGEMRRPLKAGQWHNHS